MEFVSSPVDGPKKPIKRLNSGYVARRRRRILSAVLSIVVVGAIAMAFAVDWRLLPRALPGAESSTAMSAPAPAPAASAETAEPPVRPIYRHSVVPGGVRSPQEIELAMQRDPVVAEHYKNIVPAEMRSERLQKPVLAHVSYRLGDKVYWTKKPVQLPANEPIMTDGTKSIRERCGNLISMDPLAPSTDEEPPPPSFDLLMDPMEFPWQLLTYVPPPKPVAPPPPGSPFVAPPPATIGTSGVAPYSNEVPMPVPEPNTLMLIGLGAAAAGAHYLRKRLAK